MPGQPSPPKIQIVPSACVVATAERAMRAFVTGCHPACASVPLDALALA